jgi:hypothetical protein
MNAQKYMITVTTRMGIYYARHNLRLVIRVRMLHADHRFHPLSALQSSASGRLELVQQSLQRSHIIHISTI